MVYFIIFLEGISPFHCNNLAVPVLHDHVLLVRNTRKLNSSLNWSTCNPPLVLNPDGLCPFNKFTIIPIQMNGRQVFFSENRRAVEMKMDLHVKVLWLFR